MCIRDSIKLCLILISFVRTTSSFGKAFVVWKVCIGRHICCIHFSVRIVTLIALLMALMVVRIFFVFLTFVMILDYSIQFLLRYVIYFDEAVRRTYLFRFFFLLEKSNRKYIQNSRKIDNGYKITHFTYFFCFRWRKLRDVKFVEQEVYAASSECNR